MVQITKPITAQPVEGQFDMYREDGRLRTNKENPPEADGLDKTAVV
jgi:hypothetical protein